MLLRLWSEAPGLTENIVAVLSRILDITKGLRPSVRPEPAPKIEQHGQAADHRYHLIDSGHTRDFPGDIDRVEHMERGKG